MMNKRIRSMVDEIFSEMKMTAENLALRDELMAVAFNTVADVASVGLEATNATLLTSNRAESFEEMI